MKTIKKIKESSKAVAGSALLVGATLAGGAAFATAQSSGSSGDATLGDYPGHFIGEDGTVSSTVVMGEDANAVDVVAGSAIAGQLGNNAFMTETQTVSTSGGVGGGFSATNGVTLDTQNDDLFYGDSIRTIRDTLTQDGLDLLSETTFTDDSGTDTDVTNFLNVGDQPVEFGNGPDGIDDQDDPVLHVPVPSEGDVSPTDYLFSLQANFEDGIDVTDADVAGEDIELFGTEFTIAEDNELPSDETTATPTELVLYGSSDTISVDSGASTTATVGGEEVTMEVVGVTDSSTAAVRINGELEQLTEDEETTVNGEDVRADEVIQTNADSSQGTVQFSIGSQELVLEDGQQIEDGDGDEIEGTHVEFNGGEFDNLNADEADGEELSSIEVYVGAQDDDNDYVAAGGTFVHEALDHVEFQFAGLNPDAADSEEASEVMVEANGDTEAQISFTADSGDSVTQDFLHDSTDADDDTATTELADSDNDQIATLEGQGVKEDGYFTTDAGDFAHMWEVTSVDFDTSENDESTVDITDVVTGESVEVELNDFNGPSGSNANDNEFAGGKEIIDGQSYYFVYNNNEGNLYVTYGDGAGFGDEGDTVSVAPAVDTQNGGAVSFFEPTDISADTESIDVTSDEFTGTSSSLGLTASDGTGSGSVDVTVSDADSGGADDLDVEVSYNDASGTDQTANLDITQDEGSATFSIQDGSGAVTVNSVEVTSATGTADLEISSAGTGSSGPLTTTDLVSPVSRTLELPSTESTDEQTVSVSYSSTGDTDPSGTVTEPSTVGLDFTVNSGDQLALNNADDPSAVYVQPENDDDVENAFILDTTGYDSDDGYSFAGSDARDYTGSDVSVKTLEATDDDVDAGYNEYGTYVRQDTQDEGSVSLHVPAGQSTAGAAFTGADGEISMTGGGGTGTVETMTPTGFSNQYTALDSDSSVSSAKQNRHLVLVGGPAVNSVVGELVEANETMAGSEYTEGQGMLQLVEDAFSEGHDALIVAGHSGEDTRAAGEFLVNHDENSDALEGSTQVTVNTAEGTVVQ